VEQFHIMPRVLVVIAAVLFGTTGTAQALGPEASPLAVGAARIAVGAVLLLAAARLVGRGRRTRAWSRGGLLAAAGGIAGYQLAFFAAVADTGVAVGTVVALGSAPALAGLLARFTGGAALDGRWAACTALATAGVLLLVLSGAEARVSLPGVALALGAGASYATYTVASKRLLADGHAPEAVMARGFGLAAIALAPLLVLSGGGVWSAGGLALALYLGAIPTALAYVLFARGLQRLTAGETATLTLAEPLTAAALGTLVLAERPGLLALAGAGLVLAGIAALAAPRRPRWSPLRAQVAEARA
jgi:DME family drug/metabolite transporter